jgi:hypothetical protein
MSEVNGTVSDDTTPAEVEQVVENNESEYGITLDDLMKADFSDDPIMGQTHKGLKNYNDILQNIPEDARKLVANLRAMATTKTQEVADQRRQLQTERENLIRDREALLSGNFRQNLENIVSKPIEYDPWTEEGIQARIQQESAKMFQQMLAPMQAELEAAKHAASLEAFKSANPDLLNYRDDIAKLLISREDLKLEDAYFIAKGQKAAQFGAQERDAAKSRVSAVQKTSTGQNINGVTVPKFANAWEAYSFFKDNPEASSNVNKASNKIRR